MFVSNVLFSFGIAKVGIFLLLPNFFAKIFKFFFKIMYFGRKSGSFMYFCMNYKPNN